MSAVRSDYLDEEQAPLVGTRRRFGGEQLHSTTSYRDDPVRAQKQTAFQSPEQYDTIRQCSVAFWFLLVWLSSKTDPLLCIYKNTPLVHFEFPEKSKNDTLTKSKFRNRCRSCLTSCGCSSHAMKEEEGPDGLYYRDDFNDSPSACSLGTSEEHGVWMNMSDKAGTIMSMLVWLLLGEFHHHYSSSYYYYSLYIWNESSN